MSFQCKFLAFQANDQANEIKIEKIEEIEKRKVI
jgi:hypothetical protein